ASLAATSGGAFSSLLDSVSLARHQNPVVRGGWCPAADTACLAWRGPCLTCDARSAGSAQAGPRLVCRPLWSSQGDSPKRSAPDLPPPPGGSRSGRAPTRLRSGQTFAALTRTYQLVSVWSILGRVGCGLGSTEAPARSRNGTSVATV